jgi:CheY-like chemotaxis protein
VVVASGYNSEELMEGARTAGVVHVVHKPNTVEEFADVIHRFAPASNPPHPPQGV